MGRGLSAACRAVKKEVTLSPRSQSGSKVLSVRVQSGKGGWEGWQLTANLQEAISGPISQMRN